MLQSEFSQGYQIQADTIKHISNCLTLNPRTAPLKLIGEFIGLKLRMYKCIPPIPSLWETAGRENNSLWAIYIIWLHQLVTAACQYYLK